jgi:hypothetical protein
MKYGIPYMGSKSKICKYVCKKFPKADHFYDLFGGGFSITHYMLKHRSRDYKEFHFNEIRPGICELIKDAIDGKYNYNVFKPKWISREEFEKEKENNAYIKIIWSFGNSGKEYLFGKEIEDYKRSLHKAIIFNEFDDTSIKTLGINKFKNEYKINDRRYFLRNRQAIIQKLKVNERCNKLQQLQQLERLERLQQLEQLERLQQLQQLIKPEQIYFYNKSYEQIEIKKNSVIYCDIPYKNTAGYDENKIFKRDEFLNWANDQENPVYISEYKVDDNRFKEIYSIEKRSLLGKCKNKNLYNLERLYVNKSGMNLHK